MEYFEVKRKTLFKNEYIWKAHFKASVLWTEEREIWNNPEDKVFMEGVEADLNYYAPGDFIRQGAVVYCKTIDGIYPIRMRYDDRIIKIEKALVDE